VRVSTRLVAVPLALSLLAATVLLAGAAPAYAAPANDAFSAARPISGMKGVAYGTIVGATIETGTACGEPPKSYSPITYGDRSVWYRWTVPANGTLADGEVVQIQNAYHPLPVALASDGVLEAPEPITQGIYAALAAAGHPPASFTELVTAREPTPEEAQLVSLGLNTPVPVLQVERVTYDAGGRPLEALWVVSAGDRTLLAYEKLPLGRRVEATDASHLPTA
jgi:UTRA domain